MARGMCLMLDDPDARAAPRNLGRRVGQTADVAEQVQRDLVRDVRRQDGSDPAFAPSPDSRSLAVRGAAGRPIAGRCAEVRSHSR